MVGVSAGEIADAPWHGDSGANGKGRTSRDTRPSPTRSREEPAAAELAVRGRHRHWADPELTCKHADRWQLRCRSKLALADRRLHARCDLAGCAADDRRLC